MKHDVPGVILLVLGVLGVLKSTVGLVKPAWWKRGAAWGSRALAHVPHLAGGLGMAFGAFCLVAILLDQPLRLWVLGLLAALYIGVGVLCLRQGAIQRMLDALVIERPLPVLQVLAGAGLILSVALLWIAVRG